MSQDLIRQHKCMAMGDMPDVPSIESQFKQVRGSNIPRGEMKDSRRKGSDQDRDDY